MGINDVVVVIIVIIITRIAKPLVIMKWETHHYDLMLFTFIRYDQIVLAI